MKLVVSYQRELPITGSILLMVVFLLIRHENSHVFEANVGYDFSSSCLNWYTNFAGNDGLNKDGDRAYSSYVEATAPFKLGL